MIEGIHSHNTADSMDPKNAQGHKTRGFTTIGAVYCVLASIPDSGGLRREESSPQNPLLYHMLYLGFPLYPCSEIVSKLTYVRSG